MTLTTQDDRLFECAFCGALKRSRIIPIKCESCGHESFMIYDPGSEIKKDDKEEKK